ncbi:hypothetical protein OUZ56_003379 [Daphnia magna]|uniref:Uncharacterized protein n=1 Tax=Daphnia magna TaxID=35525 RepID=A0ABR0A8R3_9CRUS|nr:hypothetical protein OUZ56_003379 [Daphnia magna]
MMDRLDRFFVELGETGANQKKTGNYNRKSSAGTTGANLVQVQPQAEVVGPDVLTSVVRGANPGIDCDVGCQPLPRSVPPYA